MSDLLVGGADPDRPGSSGWRRVLLGGVVVALVLVAAARVLLAGPGPGAEDAPPAGAAGTLPPAAPRPTAPTQLQGRQAGPAEALSLLLSGGPTVARAGTAPVTLGPVEGLRLGADEIAADLVARRGGAVLAVVAVTGSALPEPRAVWVLPPDGPARRMAGLTAGAAVAAAADDRVWLARDRPDGPTQVEQRDVTGRPFGAPVALPAGRRLLRGLAGDRLLLGSLFGGGPLEVLEPASGRVVRRIGTSATAVAASPTVVVWQESCGLRCPLRVTSLEGGDDAVFDLPSGLSTYPGTVAALSPDGSRLALSVLTGSGSATAVVLLAVGDGRVDEVPGTQTESPGRHRLAWSAPGDALVVVQATPAGTRTGVYRPGSTELAVADLPRPVTPDSVVVEG